MVGPLLYLFAPEAKGHGVPEVVYAVAVKGGRIRPIVALIKALASSICIGTGGSVGREGPIVQIGSTLGSSLGQIFRMSNNGTRLLVACGAAGGIAATFNAPVAGVLFALEVILGDFAVGHFATVVVSSVTASVVARIFVGDVVAFQVPEYALRSPWELLLYALLGTIAAVVGVGFTKLLYKAEDGFEALKFPEYLKRAVGGLLIGTLALFVPQVLGVGYESIEKALHDELALSMLLVLVGAKVVATCLTLGSGGSGGVFAPSLFIGASLGGSFGTLAHSWLPGITAPGGAYALVGMAAVFSAAARAPITAVTILFEMTGDYRIILPLMLATVIATLAANRLQSESIYTLKLARRGIRLERGRDVDVMRSVKVVDVMTRNPVSVDASLPLKKLANEFQTRRVRALPVLEEGRLYGIVTMQDLSRSISNSGHDNLTVGDAATTNPVTVSPDDSMWRALRRMGPRDLSILPVVAPEDPQSLVAMIRPRDIVRAYNLAMMQRSEITQQVDRARLERTGHLVFADYQVETGSEGDGSRLAQLAIPGATTIVSVQRGDQVLIPKGETLLLAGDRITAFLEESDQGDLAKLFTSPPLD